jgi:hypothetical protein
MRRIQMDEDTKRTILKVLKEERELAIKHKRTGGLHDGYGYIKDSEIESCCFYNGQIVMIDKLIIRLVGI